MNTQLLQIILNPPTEGHAAAHVFTLSNEVLYKDGSRLKAEQSLNIQRTINIMVNILSYRTLF